jgi:serine/threonine protein kinase
MPSVPDGCNNLWTRGTELDRGNYGLIQRVKKTGNVSYGNYVLKVALTHDDIEELESEVSIMSQINCKGILRVVDPAPCDHQGTTIPGSFVMPQMVPNLWKWYDDFRGGKRKCRDTIARQLIDALTCLHQSNYVHGDFKGDQVLYAGLDDDNCPQGLAISDFGLSHALTNESGQVYDSLYDAEYYSISGHLVGVMFGEDTRYYKAHVRPLDPLKLSHEDDEDNPEYAISEKIDWCSFLYEMFTDLALGDDDWFDSLRIPSQFRGMDCGMMSGRRDIRIVAP